MFERAPKSTSKSLCIAMVVVASACVLAGCGRKGPLEPPPSAQVEQPGNNPAEPEPAKKRLPIDFLID